VDISSVSNETLEIQETQELLGKDAPSRARKQIYSGDIIFATIRPTLQRIAIVSDVLDGNVCSTGFVVLRTKSNLDNKFLFYYLQSARFMNKMEKLQKGASYPAVTDGEVKNQFLPLPPLAEQQRIVARLDAAFAAIAEASAAAEANLRNARALFDSYLDQVFSTRGAGWVERRLGDVTNFIDYRGKTPEKTSEGIPLITAKNIKMGYLLREPREFIAVTDYSSWMTRGIPRRGDVLFTTEAPLANVAVLDTEELVAFAQRVIILQPNSEELIGTFLMFQLMSSEIQSQIKTFATGATVQGIKASLLRRILINLPSIKQQNQINEQCNESYVTSIELINIYKSKLAALTELKQALLAEVFGAA
jgi:type I restriction enzyme S subunit